MNVLWFLSVQTTIFFFLYLKFFGVCVVSLEIITQNLYHTWNCIHFNNPKNFIPDNYHELGKINWTLYSKVLKYFFQKFRTLLEKVLTKSFKISNTQDHMFSSKSIPTCATLVLTRKDYICSWTKCSLKNQYSHNTTSNVSGPYVLLKINTYPHIIHCF